MNKRISIYFCGGCNPKIDRGQIAAKIADSLRLCGYTVIWNDTDCDFLVYISGCEANCAWRYNPAPIPCVYISGEQADSLHKSSDELIEYVISKVRNYFG